MTSVVKIADFRPAVRRRIHEDIAEQLRDAILDGRFPAGSKLPPERELAIEFKVNRTSIRDAIKVLEGLNLVAYGRAMGRPCSRWLTPRSICAGYDFSRRTA